MNKMRNWMIGLTIVSLLAIGTVAVAGNGFGVGAGNAIQRQSTSNRCALQERATGGDGIPSAEGSDCVAPRNGHGHGQGKGYGRNQSENRPLDGTGYGMRQGRGNSQSGCSGDCGGSCP